MIPGHLVSCVDNLAGKQTHFLKDREDLCAGLGSASLPSPWEKAGASSPLTFRSAESLLISCGLFPSLQNLPCLGLE